MVICLIGKKSNVKHWNDFLVLCQKFIMFAKFNFFCGQIIYNLFDIQKKKKWVRQRTLLISFFCVVSLKKKKRKSFLIFHFLCGHKLLNAFYNQKKKKSKLKILTKKKKKKTQEIHFFFFWSFVWILNGTKALWNFQMNFWVFIKLLTE